MTTIDSFIEKNINIFTKLLSGKYNGAPLFDLSNDNIIEIPHFSHMRFISNNYIQISYKLKELEEVLSAGYDEFHDGLDEDEHPCWHLFERWADNEKYKAEKEVYSILANQHHIYRVGVYNNKFDLHMYNFGNKNADAKFFKELMKECNFAGKIHCLDMKNNESVLVK